MGYAAHQARQPDEIRHHRCGLPYAARRGRTIPVDPSLAKACGVAEATIFRFCRALGFDGYNEMKIALAKATATAMPVSLAGAGRRHPDALHPRLQHRHRGTERHPQRTGPRVGGPRGHALQRARQVFFSGRAAAIYWPATSGRGSRCSPPFRTAGDSHMQAIAASLMGPEDVVVFVSYSGATRDMMDTLHLARRTVPRSSCSPTTATPRRSAGRCRAPVRCQRKPARLRQHAGQAGRPLCGERPRPALHAGQSGACQPSPAQAARWGVSCCNIGQYRIILSADTAKRGGSC